MYRISLCILSFIRPPVNLFFVLDPKYHPAPARFPENSEVRSTMGPDLAAVVPFPLGHMALAMPLPAGSSGSPALLFMFITSICSRFSMLAKLTSGS